MQKSANKLTAAINSNKIDFDELLQVIKSYSDNIDDDLLHIEECLQDMTQSDVVFEASSALKNLQEQVKMLSQEAFYLALKLRKEMKIETKKRGTMA